MNTMTSFHCLATKYALLMAVYLNLKKIEQIALKFVCCTHTKQSNASVERFQSSLTHLDPSETLQESSSWRPGGLCEDAHMRLHARDQEQTMMSSCAPAGVDLNPQLQYKTSKTDKSVIDHWSIWYQLFHHRISPLQPTTCMCVCVWLKDKAAVNTPSPSPPTCMCVCTEIKQQ